MKRRSLAGAAVVLVATAIALGQAGWNRSLVRREIVLGAREAPTAYPGRDETALWVRLDYTTPVDSAWGGWLGAARLAAMGADTSHAALRRQQMDARPAFVVLELDGPEWRAHVAKEVARREAELAADSTLAHRDSLRSMFRRGLDEGSHLILVDAGRDAETLARRYPDAAQYLILPAVLRTYRDYHFGPPHLPVDTVLGARMELEQQRLLVSGRPAAGFRSRPGRDYRVTIASGRSYAPWVKDVR